MTTVQRDITALFAAHEISSGKSASRTTGARAPRMGDAAPRPVGSNTATLRALSTTDLRTRLNSQRLLLADVDAGKLRLPDRGERVRATVTTIESLLAEREQRDPVAQATDDVPVSNKNRVVYDGLRIARPPTTIQLSEQQTMTLQAERLRQLRDSRLEDTIERLKAGTARYQAQELARLTRPGGATATGPDDDDHDESDEDSDDDDDDDQFLDDGLDLGVDPSY
ncbi:hypothetical protein BC828DRAFT_377211 [Blastocladiella britannica]|nr:hypothetical protein BC828DRAFT_377211 [Blastocladiella britannica]